MSRRAGDRVRLGPIGLGTVAQAFRKELLAFHRLVSEGEPPADGIVEGRADILTCQRIVRHLAAGRGIDLGGEAAQA